MPFSAHRHRSGRNIAGGDAVLILDLTVSAAGLAIADQTRRPTASAFSFATFWGAYGAWIAFHQPPCTVNPVFLLLTIGFLMYLAWTPFERLVRGVELRRQHMVVLGLNGVVYFGSSYALLRRLPRVAGTVCGRRRWLCIC